MVKVVKISWMLITATFMYNVWCEINCNTSSDSDDDTSICDTDSENDSKISYGDLKRTARIKHKTNKKNTVYQLSYENVKSFESEPKELAIQHDDIYHHDLIHHTTNHENMSELPVESDKDAKSYKTQKSLDYQKEHDSKQNTKIFKTGHLPSENLFDNAKKPRSSNSLIKLVVEKITKRNVAANTSSKPESTTILSLKDFLSKHGLRATEMSSKQNYHYEHKTYGITLKSIVKPRYVEQEIMEKTSLGATLRNKMNLLRSTRIDVSQALDLQLEQASSESASTTTTINTDLNEDLSPYAIEKQMRRVAVKYKDNMNVTIETLGRTVEYNDIILMKITDIDKRDAYLRAKEIKYADEVEQKKIIFIVHGLSVIGMKYLISNEEVFHKLLKYYTDYLDKFDIFLIPMANPDGYAATCNSHVGLYWNKNMSPQRDCPGVALDRNFNVDWDKTRNISSCNAMYPGPEPFSEAETRAVQKVFHLYGHRMAAYIHVHASSFDQNIFKGDAVLYPHGYTDAQTDDDKYIDMKGEIDEAMKNSSFRMVTVTTDTLYNWYGKVTGTSVDYASTVYGIPYALEFSMQVYKGIQIHALETIWKRVIDVVFNNIWKSSQRNLDY